MTILIVCKFNVMYEQKTEVRKLNFLGGTLILAPLTNFKHLKKISHPMIPNNTQS